MVFTATVQSCPSPLYRFWVIDTNRVGTLVQSWSGSSQHTLASTVDTPPGTYTIQVDARDASDANVEQSVKVPYQLGSPPAANPCTNLTVTSDPSPPQLPGTSVVFTATVQSCPSPLYRFWLIDLNRVGTLVQGWSGSSQWTFASTVDTPPGAYTIQVDARDASDADVEQSVKVAYLLG